MLDFVGRLSCPKLSKMHKSLAAALTKNNSCPYKKFQEAGIPIGY